MTKFILLGAAAAAAFASAAPAQTGPARPLDRAGIEAQVREHFSRVDANRDGFIDQAETQAFRATARADRQRDRAERRQAMFARLDANRDGSLSLAEFNAPRADRAQRGDRAERRGQRADRRSERRSNRMERRADRGPRGFGMKAIERLDADRDGRVSLAEATTARLQRFDRVDTNRDGTISREEREAARGQRQNRRG